MHRDTNRQHVLLGDTLWLQNNFESVLEELEQAFEIQKEVLGKDDDSTKDTEAKMKMKGILARINENSN